MATVNEFDVLIASPGDVKREREIAARTIDELNALLDCHKLRLRTRMWECDGTPEVGERPQAILNRQIGDSCDIFVGIMWSRVGTPTGAAKSGTIEEYQRARARLDRDPQSVRILFFFSDCPISPGAIDTEQLASVRHFRNEIEQLGLVSTYSSHAEFELKLRVAIYRNAVQLSEWRATGNDSQQPESVASLAKKVELSTVVDESSQDAELANAAMNQITQSLLEFAVNTEIRTHELKELKQSANFSVEQLEATLDSAAADLESLAIKIPDSVAIQNRAFSRYFERMSDVIIFSEGISLDPAVHSQLSTVRFHLDFLAEHMRSTAEKSLEFIRLLDSDPSLSSQLYSAKRQVCRTMAEFVDSINRNASLVEAVRDQLYSYLDLHCGE